ncbi:hypothetical protein HDU76_005010 [Blyttiomyces sp. JEL0837]|nr:hypothetical protein HDU76_005010 [Blyttiomyces sp. JEL0837]
MSPTAGSAAGIVNAYVASPIELIKIRLQAQYAHPPSISSSTVGGISGGKPVAYHGPIDVAKSLIRDYGVFRGLFHGTWATILREIPAYAGFYGGFEYAKRILTPPNQPKNTPLPVSKLMIAGAFGGVMYWTCCYPLDVAKSRIQQMNPGMGSTGMFDNLKLIYNEGGVKGLFRGYVTCVVRSIPAAAATFTVYELTVRAMSG